MYPISPLYTDYLKRHDREFLVRASVGNEEFDNTQIVDFSIESSLTSSEEFEIGTAIYSKLTIRMRTHKKIKSNTRIVPYIALSLARMTWEEASISWEDNNLPWIGGATEWLPLGEFFVDSRVKINDVWEFTCYDKLVFADVPYVSSLSYPATQQQVFDEICGRLGYSYDSSVVINPAYVVPVAPSGFSMRQVLSYISGANCGSLFVGKSSLLRMKRFMPNDEPVFDLGLSDYIRAKQTNPLKSFDRVVITYDTEDDLTFEVGAGDENHTLYMENPLVTQTIADAIHASLSGVSYLPLSMDARGFPQLEQGDRIDVGLYEGTSWMEAPDPWEDTTIPWTGVVQHQSYILRQVLSFKGGLQLKIEAPSISEQQSEFVVEGSLSAQVNKLDKTAVKEGKRYYGVTITRPEGLVIERDDGASKAIFNSDELSFYADGERALWFDLPSRKYKFSGTLEAVDGVFSGDLYAVGGTFTGTLEGVDGTFSGTISASIIEGSEINGGKITGALIRTSEPGIYPRVQIDPTSIAFGVYADETNGILIPAYDGGMSKIIFLAGSNQSTLYNSPAYGFALTSHARLGLFGDEVDLDPGGGYVRVPSWGKLYSNQSLGTLQGQLDAIWSALAGKANASHYHSVTIPPGTAGGTFTVS